MSRFPLANTNKESLKQCEQIEKRHVYGKKKKTNNGAKYDGTHWVAKKCLPRLITT